MESDNLSDKKSFFCKDKKQDEIDYESEIKNLQEELNKTKNEYLRSLADLINLKNRFNKDKEEILKTSNILLLKDILPIIDNMKIGIEILKNKYKQENDISKGFNIVLNQMQNLLQNNGVEEINPINEFFNPEIHESLSIQNDDKIEENKVIKVIRIGYLLNNRLLRPASVIISSGASKK